MRNRKKNKSNPTAAKIVDARREGQYVRATTWSAQGEQKDPKRNRRKDKAKLREYC